MTVDAVQAAAATIEAAFMRDEYDLPGPEETREAREALAVLVASRADDDEWMHVDDVTALAQRAEAAEADRDRLRAAVERAAKHLGVLPARATPAQVVAAHSELVSALPNGALPGSALHQADTDRSALSNPTATTEEP